MAIDGLNEPPFYADLKNSSHLVVKNHVVALESIICGKLE